MKKKHFYSTVILLSFLALGIQPALATIELNLNGWNGVGDVEGIGTWDSSTRTGTLTHDVYDTIEITEGEITLDGAEHTVTPATTNDDGVDFSEKSLITVQNLIVNGGRAGISLRSSNNCTISHNTLNGCQYGIWVAGSDDTGSDYNLVTDNTADNSLNAGIWLHKASYNNIAGNTTQNSSNGYGIYAMECTNNNDLTNNTIINNEVGIELFKCSNFNSSITGNNVSSNTFFGIHLLSSSNNTLAGNTVSNNNQGIYLEGSDDNTLTNNTTSTNISNGIGLRNSSENILSNNTTSNNNFGVRIWAYAAESSINNQIYNNNFIVNTTHADVFATGGGIIDDNLFNLDPPIGGNYWSGWESSNPYIFNGGQDESPWPEQDGWITNEPPVADAGDGQTVECACQSTGTQVTLDGTGSSDPDGDPLISYTWTGPFEEGQGTVTGVTPTVTLSGCQPAYVITLVVNDGQVDSEPDTVTISVVDTTPPDVIPPGSVTIQAMGPDSVAVEDERIQAFLAGVSANDNCDPEPDITNDAPSEFLVGEETTVTFTAKDTSNNFSTCQSTVTVVEAAESSLRIIPPIINRNGRLERILAVIRFPEGTTAEDIDIGQPIIMCPGDSPDSIEAINQRIVPWNRCGTLRVSVFACFSKDEVTAGVDENGPAELMVIGRFINGQYFYGFDDVWIIGWDW